MSDEADRAAHTEYLGWLEQQEKDERLFEVFCAGFAVSGEGCNAEYPYEGRWDEALVFLRKRYEEWKKQ